MPPAEEATPDARSFDAEVRASGRGSHAVVVPRTVVAALPSRRVEVHVGAETFEATLGAYGGRTFLGLRKSLLTALGVTAGDTVHVRLEPAAAAPETEAPLPPTTCAELDEALADDDRFAAAWARLPDGHREEYGRWVSGGDEPDARRARVDRVRHRLART